MSVAIGTGLAIAGIGASAGAGIYGSHKAGQASKTAAASADAATAEQKRQYDENVKRQQPWIDSGSQALSQLNKMSQPGADFTADPGYQFRVAQGQKAIERSAASRGRAANPATDMALSRYNQDQASQEYQNVYNRLAQRAGVGQAATNELGAAGANYANNAGNSMMAAGNARASGYANQGQIGADTIGNVADIFGQGLSLSKLKNKPWVDPAGDDPAHWYI